MKLKDSCSLEGELANLDSVIKKADHFASKGPSSPRYGVSRSHVHMWELDHKEGWVLKNWFFQTVVLEKTLESPLDRKEIKSVNPKGNQSWICIGRTDAKAEGPILWPPDAGNDWRQKEKGATEAEMDGWHHWLNGHELEQTPGDREGQGSLAFCSSWGRKSQRWLNDWTTTHFAALALHLW